MKKVLLSLMALIMALGLCGCMHEHRWSDATCTEPRTCRECHNTNLQ